MTRIRTAALTAPAAAALALTMVGPAGAATEPTPTGQATAYGLEVVADSAAGFSVLNCPAINDAGQIAFRGVTPVGFRSVDGVYRADPGRPALRTIARNPQQLDFVGDVSINNRGEVAFPAALDNDEEAVFRGTGGPLTTLATSTGPFNFFVFSVSLNDSGAAAFAAELDQRTGFDEGVFVGDGTAVRQVYRADRSPYTGSTSRPSLNERGAVAFYERVDESNLEGIFLAAGGRTVTVAAPGEAVSYGDPQLNNRGAVAYRQSAVDPDTGGLVTPDIRVSTAGATRVVADTGGPFVDFSFDAPAMSDDGVVAFRATLDDGREGVFVEDGDGAVVRTGDVVDGGVVTGIDFCAEGRNQAGVLAISLTLQDPAAPGESRVAIVRATPQA